MNSKFLILIIVITAVSLLPLVSCKKENGDSKITVKMIDAPGDYQEINVEVLKVRVHHDVQGWIDLPTVAGVYDLLTLQNDVSATLVDTGVFPAGTIKQMRLILGENNTIKIDDEYYLLSTPSAQQSGLKINLNAHFEPGQLYEVILDFVADESIVEQGNGAYSLKPVIKVESILPL